MVVSQATHRKEKEKAGIKNRKSYEVIHPPKNLKCQVTGYRHAR